MPDLSSVAREAAEAAALRRLPPALMTAHGGRVTDMRGQDRIHFVNGFTECASRLPSRDDLAHWYNEREDICASAFDEDDPCYKHQRECYSFADAVLALVGEKISG